MGACILIAITCITLSCMLSDTLDLLRLQNKLIGITLHQWIVMTEKTEKCKVNLHFKII